MMVQCCVHANSVLREREKKHEGEDFYVRSVPALTVKNVLRVALHSSPDPNIRAGTVSKLEPRKGLCKIYLRYPTDWLVFETRVSRKKYKGRLRKGKNTHTQDCYAINQKHNDL